MANLDFFAADADQKSVIEFLFSSADVRVFESYSEFDQDLREFRSFEELASVFPIGTDRFGNGTAILLQLWSPSVMSELNIIQFAVDPHSCGGHTFRQRIDGGGLIRMTDKGHQSPISGVPACGRGADRVLEKSLMSLRGDSP